MLTLNTWLPSKARLEELRQIGDKEADDVVDELFGDREPGAARELLNALLEYEMREEQLPKEAIRLLADQRSVRFAGPPDIARGQQVFAEHGPEIFMILGCYSLPAAYAAENGVEVLAQTGFLTEKTDRRLVETAQMIVDVMTPGGLEPGGIGITSAEKVRLMHAAIRHLILNRQDQVWDVEKLGIPINQEDMAGTLGTFSYLVLDGLDKMGVRLDARDQESYTEAWGVVGALMGVLPELIPKTFAQAKELSDAIQADQVAPSVTGETMLGPLLETLDEKMLPGVPAALMRLYLPREVADGLGVPKHLITDVVVRMGTRLIATLDNALRRWKEPARIYRHLSMSLLEHLIEWDRGGQRPDFRLPDDLRWYWEGQAGKRSASRAAFGASLATIARARQSSSAT